MQIFDYCKFLIKPVEAESYVTAVRAILGSGVPATVTVQEVEQNNGEPIDGVNTGTSPLHAICSTLDPNDPVQIEVAEGLIETLFEYGAGWMMLDENNETPGCIAFRRGLPDGIYKLFVNAGTRSEVLLRRLSADSDDGEGEGEEVEAVTSTADAAVNNEEYLKSELKYSDHALTTDSNNDGVMMDWEDKIMERSAELLAGSKPKGEAIVLNVGFGLGIIDRYLQAYSPKKHYISEAHPDVLRKMKQDGWYDKPNVVILEGRWQDTVPKLLDEHVYLDGIYYDTFSEHYQDLVDFFDVVVGLLEPEGIFSFFNGLGADRQVCYDVYSQVVEIDLQDYGLKVEYEDIPVEDTAIDWKDIRRKYWCLKNFRLPKITFM